MKTNLFRTIMLVLLMAVISLGEVSAQLQISKELTLFK